MSSKKTSEAKKQKNTKTKTKAKEMKNIPQINVLDTIIKNMEAQNVSVHMDYM